MDNCKDSKNCKTGQQSIMCNVKSCKYNMGMEMYI